MIRREKYSLSCVLHISYSSNIAIFWPFPRLATSLRQIARMNGRVRLRTSDTSETHGHKLRRCNLSSNSNAISVDVYWTLFGFYYCHRPLCMRYRCIELRRLHSFGGCCRFRPVAGSYCRRRSTADRNARERKKKRKRERDICIHILRMEYRDRQWARTNLDVDRSWCTCYLLLSQLTPPSTASFLRLFLSRWPRWRPRRGKVSTTRSSTSNCWL